MTLPIRELFVVSLYELRGNASGTNNFLGYFPSKESAMKVANDLARKNTLVAIKHLGRLVDWPLSMVLTVEGPEAVKYL